MACSRNLILGNQVKYNGESNEGEGVLQQLSWATLPASGARTVGSSRGLPGAGAHQPEHSHHAVFIFSE